MPTAELHTVDLHGEELCYSFSHIPGEGPPHPPLVLVHGSGGNHLHWPPQLRRLPGGPVYALDMPGHGCSGGRPRPSIATYREVVREFAQALDLPPFVLAGHSMGGAIALDFALHHPERLRGMGLVGTGARLRVAPAILEGLLTDFQATTELITDWALAPSVDPKMRAAVLERMRETPAPVIHNDFAACDAFDVMGRLAEIHTPALIVCGTEDRLTPPKYSQYLHQHLPDSRLVLVPQAGHMVMLEQPQAVTQAFQRFLDELAASGG